MKEVWLGLLFFSENYSIYGIELFNLVVRIVLAGSKNGSRWLTKIVSEYRRKEQYSVDFWVICMESEYIYGLEMRVLMIVNL